MKYNRYIYLLFYIFPAVVLFSLQSKNAWSYSALILVFVLVPVLEILFKNRTYNLSSDEEKNAANNKWFDLIIYPLVPIQYFSAVFFIYQISDESIPLWIKLGLTSAYGMSCGLIGINVAHELGHRNSKFEQFLSKLLLLSSFYMHFFIEHNKGHHKNVATHIDPATSRYGETIYAFYIRSIFKGWLSAWKIQTEILRKKKSSFFSFENEMFWFQIIQLLIVLAIGFYFGLTILLFFLLAALIGILLLESINYIEHYGLVRKKNGDYYERNLPVHSWNCSCLINRIGLFELSRHSDHHYKSNKKYQVLSHYSDCPQTPTGYAGMILLALVPPLWFFIMHKRISQLKFKLSNL